MDAGFKLILISWTGVILWIGIIILNQRKHHPRALFVLFFAEMWERFSFYGMRALLILYMTKELFVSISHGEADAKSYGIYGAYNALLYATPVIGGMLADRLLGFRYAVILGGIIMAIGQFTLAATIGNSLFFFAGLAMIAIGNGFFKPNISSFLGKFYETDDPRKDSAFTMFYMGINVGAFLAPVTCGYIGETIDWSLGFLAAGAGMVLGIFVFWRNMKIYQDKGNPPDPEKLRSAIRPPFIHLTWFHSVVLGVVIAVPLVAVLIGFEKITNLILGLAALVCLGYISYRAATLHDKAQAGKLIAFVILFLFHMIFWALYEQAGGSINLLTDRYVNRHGMDASQYQAVPAMFIVLMAPFFSFFWVKLRKLKMEPYTSVKFFWGLIFMAAGYLVLMAGIRYSLASGQMIPLIFLIGMYFFHITGELSISPIGLSIVTKLSPPGITGFVMGAWFLSIALGHKIAGFLGQRIASPEMETGTTGALKAFAGVYFTWGVVVMLGSAAILIFLTPWLRRWMSGIH